MYRLLVVLVTLATAKGQYGSFGYSSLPISLGSGASLSQGSFYSQPPPPPIGLGQFGSQSSIGFGGLSSLSPISSSFGSGSHQVYIPKPSFGSSGDYSDRSQFESGKRGQNEQRFAQENGRHGQEFDESSNGFKQGTAAARNLQADSGFFAGQNGEKRFANNGNQFFGDKRFQQEGKNEAGRKVNNGHKKGRVVKGFKDSHHKDEQGESEQYFDEENDEGVNFNIRGESGSFGEKQASAFKGAQENSELRANEGAQKQHYDNQQSTETSRRDGDQYGSRKFGSANSNYGSNNGGGEESIQGHSSGSKFEKHNSY